MQHIGLGYLASNLEKDNNIVDIIECPGEGINIKQLVDIISGGGYDIIGFTT